MGLPGKPQEDGGRAQESLKRVNARTEGEAFLFPLRPWGGDFSEEKSVLKSVH